MKRGIVLLLVGGLLTLAAPSVPSSAVDPGSNRVARQGDQVSFTYERGSLRPGSVVRNVSGRLHGRVVVADGGRLRPATGRPGRSAKFPCVGCGRAIIEVPDRSSLDPGTRAFQFGTDVWMTRGERRQRTNVVQKGYFDQHGGQYKLQIDYGRPNCVIRGTEGLAIARATVNVANRRWHRITCSRTGDQVVLRVDGVIRAQVTAPTGAVANGAPVRIGGKNVVRPGNDQYHGRLDDVFIRIRR